MNNSPFLLGTNNVPGNVNQNIGTTNVGYHNQAINQNLNNLNNGPNPNPIRSGKSSLFATPKALG